MTPSAFALSERLDAFRVGDGVDRIRDAVTLAYRSWPGRIHRADRRAARYERSDSRPRAARVLAASVDSQAGHIEPRTISSACEGC
jgi:hypothetical protein